MMATVTIFAYILFFFTSSCSTEEYRLPELITPTLYDLKLNINPEDNEYTGIERITFQASNITKDIYIHSDTEYVNITLVILNNNAKCYITDLKVGNVHLISCTRAFFLDKDNSLYIEFNSKYSTDGYGLFKTSYVDGENEFILIESNFKPTFARRAFPCLDEPDFKAAFSIEITHPKRYTALSTSTVSSTTDVSEDLKKTTFEDTPEISTYLLSIFLSKLHQAKTSAEDGLDFKIFTRSAVASLTKTVANTYYHQIIQKLDDFTGIPYQNLSNVESYMVVLPDYYDEMGDFGLFTYRETELLDEGDKTSNIVKQNIISTMAYKLSHEWYGSNVATKWWSDVWANEAVATYMKYIISDQVDETLELTNQFLLEVRNKVWEYESYSFAQPLSSEKYTINDTWSIKDKLNSVNQEKGASILHMFSIIIGGKDTFKSSLQNHFQKRRDEGTDGIDIMEDILENMHSHFDMDYTYLQNWISSPGYPLLSVSLQETDNTTDIVNITQKRFLYPTDDVAKTNENSDWYVPLTSASLYVNPSDVHVDVFLTPGEHMMYFFHHDQWLVINSHGSCFYRVNYDEELWSRILTALSINKDEFHSLQRSQFIDDIFSSARIGEVDYSLAFEMTDLLFNETEYYPWYSAFNVFSYLLDKLENEEVELSLKNYILNLMDYIIVIPSDRLATETDTHINVLKKVMMLNWACNLDHAECITYAIDKFAKYKESQESLDDYNARGVIFCTGIRRSEDVQKDWDFLWNMYTTTNSVHEQADILSALGCAVDKDILLSYLKKIIATNSGIKRQDVVVVFKSVFKSSLGLEAAMEFLESSVSDIKEMYNDMQVLSEMIYALAEKLISDDHINWLNNFLNDAVFIDFNDIRTKASTLAAVNSYWKKKFRGGVIDIFPPSSTEYPTEETTDETPSTTPSSALRVSIEIYTLLSTIITFVTLFNKAHMH